MTTSTTSTSPNRAVERALEALESAVASETRAWERVGAGELFPPHLAVETEKARAALRAAFAQSPPHCGGDCGMCQWGRCGAPMDD